MTTNTAELPRITGGTSGSGATGYTCGRTPAKVAQLQAQWAEATASGHLIALTGDVTEAAFITRFVPNINYLIFKRY